MNRINFSIIALVISLAAFSSTALALTVLHVPAVDTNGNGVLTEMQAQVISGDGDIYVDTKPYISVDTQQSARVAAEIAAATAKIDLKKYDVLYKILARTQVVDGPSGGGALALLAYSEFTGKKPRNDMAMTGTVERDGTIGPIGGVMEKALSLKGTQVKLFLVPKGQSVSNGESVADAVKGFGVQVVEIRNFQDVIDYAFTPEGSQVQSQTFVEGPLVVQKVNAPAELNPLKQIALDELSALQKDYDSLLTDKNATLLLVNLKTALNESRYLLDQGYYYSAANEVFIARIAVDSYRLHDLSQIDFMKRVQLLENDAKTVTFEKETPENMEWVVGAKLRYYWALNKIQGVKKNVGTIPLDQLYSEYSASKSWISAAKKMNAIAKGLGGTPFPSQNGAKDYARKLIDAINRSQAYVLDTEVNQHYEGALSAYDNGDYAASVFDGLFAKALAEGGDTVDNTIGSDLTSGLHSAADLPRYNASIWAQYYFIHSLYSLAQANRTNEFSFTANAIKLQGLSEILKEDVPQLKQALLTGGVFEDKNVSIPDSSGNGKPSQGISIRTTIVPEQSSESTIILVLLGALGLILIILLLRKGSGAAPEAQPSAAEKIEKLDELLLKGKISEQNWEVLHERYVRQLRKEQGAAKAASPAPKKKTPSKRA